MSRTIGVVGVQVAPRPYDVEATLAKFEREVRRLATAFPAFDLYVFPELYLSALGSYGDEPPRDYARQVAQTIPGPLTDRVGAISRAPGRWIVAGSIYERAGNDLHNTAIVASPDGDLVATYRKLFPWMPYEGTKAGDRYVTFDIPSVGRFGLAICYDGWVPEIMRTLASLGAEVIIQPTATRTVDREQELVLARANAITNQVYIVNPNNGDQFGRGPVSHGRSRGPGAGPGWLGRGVPDPGAGSRPRPDDPPTRHRRVERAVEAAARRPTAPAGPYRDGFAAGEVMVGLGTLKPTRRRRPR